LKLAVSLRRRGAATSSLVTQLSGVLESACQSRYRDGRKLPKSLKSRS
jgi:hypothetical protein